MDQLSIIKIGGKVLEDSLACEQFLAQYEQLKGLKILVHGGGSSATALQKSLGQEAVLLEGRRVTDAAALRAVTMVYAGLINKQVVARLNAGGYIKAVGLSGADGNFITATKRSPVPIDYGFVGDVETIDLGFINLLIRNGLSPVVAPITADVKGQLLNINADTMAQEIAVAATKQYKVVLTYCFDQPGVMEDLTNPDSIVPFINSDKYAELKASGTVSGGMLPKLDNAFKALSSGLQAVRICSAEHLLDGIGTTLVL